MIPESLRNRSGIIPPRTCARVRAACVCARYARWRQETGDRRQERVNNLLDSMPIPIPMSNATSSRKDRRVD